MVKFSNLTAIRAGAAYIEMERLNNGSAQRKEENEMETNMMELSLEEMEKINGGWNWKKSVLWGVFGTVIGASIGAQIGGAPGAVAGAIIGGGAGVATGDE